MAQQDTGLGWSAKDTYLKDAPGLMTILKVGEGLTNDLAFLNKSLYPTDEELIAGNSYLFNGSAAWYVMFTSDMGTVPEKVRNGAAYVDGSGHFHFVILCETSYRIQQFHFIISDTAGAVNIYRKGTGYWQLLLDSVSGLYYTDVDTFDYNSTTYTAANFSSGTVGVYASLRDLLDNVQGQTENYYKLNSGYAVACAATYNNEGGSKTTTPVLISTSFSAVALSTDGITPMAYVSYSFLKDGVRFYMSMLPAHAESYVSGGNVPEAILTNFSVLFPQGVFNAICRVDWANVLITETVNPYGPDPSTEEGGAGQDPTDDEVPLEPVTFPSALGTGFCRIYCPTAAQLSALSDYLWGPLFDLNNVKRLFADPMDSILGLSVVPLLISGNAETVSVAGISTGIQLDRLSAQHINVDLGSLQVTEKWGAYLDYEPYTKYSIYLPFIGYRTLSADDIMGKWVHLTYDIDLLSGACVAKLVSGSTLLYQWAGTCSMQIPINASNWNSVIQSTISAIGSVATGIATGGAAAPMVAGALSSAATQATQMKPSIERAGGMSGAASFLAGRRAYMIRTFPELVNPGNQPHYIGYPSFITKRLGDLTGYNVIEDVHLEGIPATQAELEEIDTLLHEGVIL